MTYNYKDAAVSNSSRGLLPRLKESRRMTPGMPVGEYPQALPIRVSYSDNHHMAQIYAGLQMLDAAGVVRCEWESGPPGDLPNCVSITLNDSLRVHYDVSDGLNWIAGSDSENLDFFAANAPAGVVFKRSYCDEVSQRAGESTSVYPLGLNYHVSPLYRASKGTIRDRLERRVRDSRLVARVLRVQPATFDGSDYEAFPQLDGPIRIMMFTRLWDPLGNEVRTEAEAEERRVINEARVEVLSSLRREFGDRFSGGLYSDPYSLEHGPRELLLPWEATEKRTYLRTMKQHAICVATAGLHGSTGWRFAEYVAASRAIVTEPLRFDPGPGLAPGNNYIETPLDGVLSELEDLIASPNRVRGMMLANYRHYHSRLRPDALILGTLERALTETR